MNMQFTVTKRRFAHRIPCVLPQANETACARAACLVSFALRIRALLWHHVYIVVHTVGEGTFFATTRFVHVSVCVRVFFCSFICSRTNIFNTQRQHRQKIFYSIIIIIGIISIAMVDFFFSSAPRYRCIQDF